MKCTCIFASVFVLASTLAFAGDDASGPIPYSADFSQAFTSYVMSERDKNWSRSLIKKFKYRGKVVHFVRTSLPLTVANSTVNGAIYQAVERPEFFYVVNGDAMFKLDAKWPFSPGVGGFSMHAPKSRNFIVALNLPDGGVPFLSASPVKKGRVDWNGHTWDRLSN
jgi:hypothetical protein